MKELNLRQDYPEWDWTSTSNRQLAYSALTEKLNTTNFKQLVWNELVDCLYTALGELGLSWNSTYATYANTKMPLTATAAVFKATMFNSVAKNIEAVINSTWKWQYDGTYEGYVGRSNYVGAESTSNPDTLYGSAILELARKLNAFLQVMKDGDIVLDGEIDDVFYSLANATVVTPPSKPLDSDWIEAPVIDADLDKVEGIDFTTRTTSKTSQDANPELIVASESMRVRTTSRATYNATITLELLYKNLAAYIIHSMQIQAKMTVDYDSVNVRVDIPAAFVENVLLSRGAVLSMILQGFSKEEDAVNLEKIQPILLAIEQLYHSYSVANLQNSKSQTLRVINNENTVFDVSMESIQNYSFVAFIIHRSYAESNLRKGTAGGMVARLSSAATFTIPTLVNTVVAIMQAETMNCIAAINAEVNNGIAGTITAETANISGSNAVVIKQETLQFLHESLSQTVSVADLDLCLMRWLTIHNSCSAVIEDALTKGAALLASADVSGRLANNTRLELYTAGETMVARCVYSLGNTATMTALDYGENYLKSNIYISEQFEVLLANGEPFVLAINEMFHSSNVSNPELLNAENTMRINTDAFGLNSEATVGIVNLVYPAAEINSDGTITAVLTFDPSSWYNPVLEDGVLTVIQVYGSSQTGSNLNLE